MSQKKILYCASTISHLQNFHQPYIKALGEKGYQITVCAPQQKPIVGAAAYAVIPFCKTMTSPENIKNVLRIYWLLRTENFTAVSVHTSLAAAVVRAAVLLLPKKKRPKVFYTCHGYLFHEQDGWRKWKYLLPEKICAGVTDVLLVMNQTDKILAEKYRLYRHSLISIPGMGVDFSRFDIAETKSGLRQRYGIAQQAVVFVFAGEFSGRKNQQQLIAAFARVSKQMPQAKLILAGEGVLLDACKAQVQQLKLENRILFPGQVADMPALYHCSDVCVSASKIEGLPFNIMEAMYCNLPCIVSNIKGHADLIKRGKTGYLYETEIELAAYMVQLYKHVELRQQMGQTAHHAVQQYGLDVVQPQVMQVYEENL